jgi:hypothetical protein
MQVRQWSALVSSAALFALVAQAQESAVTNEPTSTITRQTASRDCPGHEFGEECHAGIVRE